MDVRNQLEIVILIGDGYALEIWNKKAAFAVVYFVISLGVAVKKMGKLTADNISKPSKGFGPLEGSGRKLFFFLTYSHTTSSLLMRTIK